MAVMVMNDEKAVKMASMNIIVNSQQFAVALRAVNKIVPSKPPIPILGYALLDAKDGALRITATDLEVTLSVTCPATIGEAGTVLLDVGHVLRMVEQFPDASVVLKTDGKTATITCLKFTSKLPTMPVENFPTIAPREGTPVALSSFDVARLIAETRYAIATESQRFVLGSALLRMTSTSIGMVTTDAKRLALATAARNGTEVSAIDNVTIPRKTLDMLSVLGDTIEMSVGTNHLFFASADRMLTSRMIDGTFPPYERIIPRDYDQTVIVNRAALAAAIRRVSVAADNDYTTVVGISPGAIRLTTTHATLGDADETVTAEYSGAPVELRLSWQYMLDFLDAASGETVTISFKDATSSVLFADGASFINVIMTIRG